MAGENARDLPSTSWSWSWLRVKVLEGPLTRTHACIPGQGRAPSWLCASALGEGGACSRAEPRPRAAPEESGNWRGVLCCKPSRRHRTNSHLTAVRLVLTAV